MFDIKYFLIISFQDTDIIVWDTVAETGICRLRGHRGPVTQITFMTTHPVLISGSKDTFIKFWDLDTQHCFKTVTGHRSEVNYFCHISSGGLCP